MKSPSILSRRAAATLSVALTLGAVAGLSPSNAQACGGLFCNSAQPVTQAGERIVFVRDGATMHMVVQLTYQGPPIDFGWLLPVPPDVQTLVAGQGLFTWLDRNLTPVFTLQTEVDPICAMLAERAREAARNNFDGGSTPDDEFSGGGEGGSDGYDDEPSVQVLAREKVGPYDQAVLRADNVEVLRTWLTDNGYQFPAGSEALLQSYIETGSAFLALKLVADADETDVVPLHLSFTSDTPAIPLRPTAVAATPDMGILVHFLAGRRAVPVNYPHVQINETAINWTGTENYADVVSQAIDEAGGQGFVTDAAVLLDPYIRTVPSDEAVAALRAATVLSELPEAEFDLSDPAISRVVARHITVPEGNDPAVFLACQPCRRSWPVIPMDGSALADDLEVAVYGSRRVFNRLSPANRYVTRLFTTMSAAEMTVDPIFDFNLDLPQVPVLRSATRHVSCDSQGNVDFSNGVIEVSDGRTVAFGEDAPEFIQRQDGLTVRGEDTTAAAVVERMFAAGQPEVIDDRRPALNAAKQPEIPRRKADGGCGCEVTSDAPPAYGALAGVFALLGVLRRRRR